MKRKNNYLPCDDVQGQQCFDGLDITVRVSSDKPVKSNHTENIINDGPYPKYPNLALNDNALERLKKQYRYEMYLFNRDCEELNKHLKSVDSSQSLSDKDFTSFNKLVSKQLKKIKG